MASFPPLTNDLTQAAVILDGNPSPPGAPESAFAFLLVERVG